MNKKLFLLTISLLVSSCANYSPYKSVESGPRAKLNFVSPSLQNRFLASAGVNLYINEATADCKVHPKGRLLLNTKIKTQSTFIPAEEYVFFHLDYYSTVLAGGTTRGVSYFAFLPRDKQEYTIEYVDADHGYSINVFQQTLDKPNESVKRHGWNLYPINNFSFPNTSHNEPVITSLPCT